MTARLLRVGSHGLHAAPSSGSRGAGGGPVGQTPVETARRAAPRGLIPAWTRADNRDMRRLAMMGLAGLVLAGCGSEPSAPEASPPKTADAASGAYETATPTRTAVPTTTPMPTYPEEPVIPTYSDGTPSGLGAGPNGACTGEGIIPHPCDENGKPEADDPRGGNEYLPDGGSDDPRAGNEYLP